MKLAVAPKKYICGVESAADDWRLVEVRSRRKRAVRPAFEVGELRAMLEATYPDDAHLASYLVTLAGEPLACQPRVNKAGLAWVLEQGFEVTTSVLVADIDNPGHALWQSTADACAGAAALLALVPTAGVYVSAKGLRLVQPLTRAIPVGEVEPILESWLEGLRGLGISVDDGCGDWTRLMRLPHVRRDGRPYRSPAVLLDGMTPIDPPPPAETFLKVPKGKRARSREPRIIGPIGPVDDSELARAFEAAGLLGQSIGASKRAAACPWETSHTTGERFDTSTVLFGPSARHPRGYFHCSHGHCAGRMQLEVIRALPAAARALILEDAPAPPAPSTLEETTARLVDTIRNAPPMLTVIQAQCGIGKTTAAQTVAAERARREHATPGEHSRAPLGSKTSIAVPTNRLAIQIAGYLRALGLSVRRFFGPLSVLRDDGSPECHYHAEGRPLASGGQSIPFQFCDGRGVDAEACEYRSTCPAYGGFDGPDDARIAIGPHTLLGELDAFAGTTGLLVIDEPPPLLTTTVLDPERIEAALASLMFFGSDYTDAMRPALEDVLAWVIGPAPLDTLTTLAAATTADVSSAFPADNRRGTAPPLRPSYAYAARRSAGLAAQLGAASEVLLAIHHALTSEVPPAVRVELRGERRVLVITAPNEALIRAVKREGGCVVTDANADLHLPVLARVVGYEPAFHRFTAPDGAPIARTLIRTRAAGRKSWLDGGRFTLDGGAVQAIDLAVRWILEEPTPNGVGIIAPKLLRLVLAAGLGDDVAGEWRRAGQRQAALDDAATRIAPLLAQLTPKPLLGHYGALRGLDSWKDVDALVTLGDPWPNLADAQHDVDFLGLPDAWEARYEALARAEIEQAHGRIRAVHRRLPCRAAHVGVIYPGGWPDDAQIRHVEGGRPKMPPSMPLDELRLAVVALGGTRATARALGKDRAVVTRWLAGQGIAVADVQRLRALASSIHVEGGSKTPYLRSSYRGLPSQTDCPSGSKTPYKANAHKGLPSHLPVDADDSSPISGSRPPANRNGRARPRPVVTSSPTPRPSHTHHARRRVLGSS